jgi:hypothetical protein
MGGDLCVKHGTSGESLGGRESRLLGGVEKICHHAGLGDEKLFTGRKRG